MAEIELKQLQSEWEKNPETDAFYPLACAYLKSGLLAAAADVLHQGLRWNSSHSRALAALGQVLYRHKDVDEARDVLARALTSDPTCRDALCTLAEIEIEAGNFQRAGKWLARAESLDATSSSVPNVAPCGASSTAVLRHQLEQRRHRCDADLADIPFVTETMVELYLKQGLQEKAVAALSQLVKRKPEDVALRRRLDELRICVHSPFKSACVQEQLSALLRAIEYQKRIDRGDNSV
ncbi:MAG: tetratricopeptide repeat protein [Desulfuromonas sp.]|nr:tetratricopeptide repeat protein [Desulfuromonas sp.]